MDAVNQQPIVQQVPVTDKMKRQFLFAIIVICLTLSIVSAIDYPLIKSKDSIVFNGNLIINESTTNVNDSNFLLGYTWANALYPGALYSTYNATYALWAYNQTYSGSTFNTTYDAFWLSNTTIWNAIASAGNVSNLTSTYIPYVGANRNTALGIYNLTTTGMVGIGTATPTSSLYVVAGSGNVPAATLQVSGAQSYGHALKLTSIAGNGDGPKIAFNRQSGAKNWSVGVYSQGRNEFSIDEDGSENGYGTTRFLIQNNTGNVGIGTTTPAEKLTVFGGNISITGSDSAGALIFTRGKGINLTSSQSAIYMQHNGGLAGNDEALVFDTGDPSYDYRFKSNRTDVLVINGNGNVGIGTSPSELLTLGGQGNGDDFAVGLRTETAGGASTRTIITQSAASGSLTLNLDQGSNGPSTAFVIQQTGAEVFRITDTGNVSLGAGRWINNVSSPLVATDVATKAYVDAINASSSVADDWNVSGNNLFPKSLGYNIGVGTTNAASKLTVVGQGSGSSASGVLFVNETSGTPQGWVAKFQRRDNQPAAGIAPGNATVVISDHPANYPFAIMSGSSNAPVFTVHGHGHVGVNTSFSNISTAQTFVVNGNVNLSNNLFVNSTRVGIGTTSPNYKLEINALTKALNVSNNFFVNATTVGIGQSLPVYPLEINRNISNISLWVQTQVSAQGYITRTDVYDESKEGAALAQIKDSASYFNPDGSIDHTAFGYAYVSYPNKRFVGYNVSTREEEQCTEEEVGFFEETFTNESGTKTVCETVEVEVQEPVYESFQEEGIDMVKQMALQQQAIYELKKENEQLRSQLQELCSLKQFSWCI